MIRLDLPYPHIARSPGIYRIIDRGSGRFYIGSAANLYKRWMQHRYNLNRGNHSNPIMQAIWNDDQSRLEFCVTKEMEGANITARLLEEQRQLDEENVGINRMCMNILSVAGSHQGRKRSKETIERLRAANVGRIFTSETKEKMRLAKLGTNLTEDHKRKIGDAARGKRINRPKGIINHDVRKLSPHQVLHLRKLREEGMSWAELSLLFDMNLSACRRAALGKTYQDIK